VGNWFENQEGPAPIFLQRFDTDRDQFPVEKRRGPTISHWRQANILLSPEISLEKNRHAVIQTNVEVAVTVQAGRRLGQFPVPDSEID
jgi:hypothetical protein